MDGLRRQLAHQRSTNSYLRDQVRKLQKGQGKSIYNSEFDDSDDDKEKNDEKVNELKEYYET